MGAEQASKALFDAGCRVFFVAQASEGVRVRAIVGKEPAIYVLNGLIEGAGRLDPYAAHDLRPVLGSLEDLRIWSASGLGGGLKAALHVDTGMNRLGLPPGEALALAGQAGQAGPLGIDLDVVAGEPRTGDFEYAVNNSFGFGGHNVALAFGRY